jgi:preprotein translocase subunit SecD
MEYYTKPKRKFNKKLVAIGIGGVCLVVGVIAGTLISTHQSTPTIKSKEIKRAPLDLKSLMNLSANSIDSGSTHKAKLNPKPASLPNIKHINKHIKAPIKPAPTNHKAIPKQIIKPQAKNESSGGFFSNLLHSSPNAATADMPKTANVEHSNLSFQILTNEIILKPQDIQNIAIRTIGKSGYGIQINLTDAASNRLEGFTQSHLNKPCQFVINDTIISLSLIRSAIGTSFVIPAENKAKAEKIYHLLVS